MWQTPVSPEPTNSTPFASRSLLAASTSGTRTANPPTLGVNSMPFLLGLPEREGHLTGRQLARVVRVRRQAEDVVIQRLRALRVPGRDVDEVDSLDLRHGVLPSGYGA